ncbi:hypothetical protein HDU98_008025 [Podochytrium sp. JEL0797]|nr:hypothetical protein HDU98_008025 [Podochytrium sp. JEL0797]
MQHGRRIWEKKMTQSLFHNKTQLANQITDLITHGRITTTVPKAKILKHYADQVVNLAKENNMKRMREAVFQPETTLPKLQLLAARYKDRHGGYTRLTLSGYNRAGSDRAPLATVEYINSPTDSVRFLASKYLPKVQSDLSTLRAQKYTSQEIVLEDPMNPGTLVTVVQRTLRADVSSKQIKQLGTKERFLQNTVNKFERSLSTFEAARVYEVEYLKTVEVKNEAKALAKLRVLQAQVDSMDAKDRGGFVVAFNEKMAGDVSRVLRMDAAGDLFWEKAAVLEEVAETGAAESSGGEMAGRKAEVPVEDGEKAAPTKGAISMMSRMMKKAFKF